MCEVVPVGPLGDSYQSAFEAVSEAYMATAKKSAKQNIDTKAALKEMEKLEELYKK